MTRWTLPRHWPVQDRARYKPLDWFVPYARNARTHPPAQVAFLAGLLDKHGPDQDVVVDEDRVVLKGHGRLLAAREAGLTHFLFTTRSGMTEAEKQAMRLSDNQVALLSGWDAELIKGEFDGLKATGWDILSLGFPEAQLRGWDISVGTESEQDPNEAPEAPKTPIVRPGDLWVLGNHRLLCGDSTSRDDVMRVLGRDRPNLMVTDPPYGVKYNPTWRDDAGGQFGDGKTVMRGKVENDDKADWTVAWDLFKGDVAYVWCASLTSDIAIAALEKSGLMRRSQIIWRKPHFQLSRGDYHWQHEPCWYAVRKGGKANWKGDRRQTTIWDIAGMNPAGRNRDEGNEKSAHGTQKPVECMKRPIENNSSAGDVVYEPFSGSGTTILAGEMTGRRILAIELDAAYCQVAIERWEKFTNQTARLSDTGQSLRDLVGIRLRATVSGRKANSKKASSLPNTSRRNSRKRGHVGENSSHESSHDNQGRASARLRRPSSDADTQQNS